MPNFKLVISDKKQSYQIEKDQSDCPLLGKKIGESFGADFLGLAGYELTITGGSDKDGFPMRKDIEGMTRKGIVLKPGIGFHGVKGSRRRKTLRGNTISTDIVQINCKVSKQGTEPLDKLLGKKEEPAEKKDEKTDSALPKEEKSEKKEEVKEEAKAEEKK